MKEPWRSAVVDLWLLSFAAGSADAAGFISLGRVFICNMTGNVVLLGISLGQGQWSDAPHFLFVLLLFMLGVAVGFLLTRQLDERAWPPIAVRVLGLEAVLLIFFAVGWSLLSPLARADWTYGLLVLVVPAMGLQTAALNRFKAPGLQTTAVTATLTAFVRTALRDSPRDGGGKKGSPLFKAAVLVLYCMGALTTGYLVYHGPRLVGAIPAGLVLAVFLLNVSRLRR